jgi:hypothetical protein
MNTNVKHQSIDKNAQKMAGGIILILAGIAFLLARWLDIGLYLVPLLGVAMLIWGAISRAVGWIIPGSVLSGIGLGIVTLEGPFKLSALVSEETRGGIFLLCFAVGWVLITLLSRLAGCKTMWWPLIPGGIMALVGGLLFLESAGLKVLEYANYIWPAALILTGLYLVVRWSRAKTS